MKPLHISTGRAADGPDTYFDRKRIEAAIWTKLKRHENLLLAAPRRTGKSSIMKNLERNPQPEYRMKYKSVQSVDSTNEFFKQLYAILLEDDAVFPFYERYYKKATGALKQFISRIRGISTKGVKIDPEDHVDYYHELNVLLQNLPETFDTLVLLIDEFPDAVRNIGRNDISEGIRFLQLNRDIRQKFSGIQLQFVYSGSIGLGNVVSKLNRKDLINDIVNVQIPPLNPGEAKELISSLELGLQQEHGDFTLGDDIKDYIVGKDSWLIPYYIQIIVDELFDMYLSGAGTLDRQSVDQAIEKIIRDRYKYQDYFENWKTRLKQAFDNREYLSALEILNYISKAGVMDYASIHDHAVKHGVDDTRQIINVLEYDGYVSGNSTKEYRFNSIILKEWWYIHVAS